MREGKGEQQTAPLLLRGVPAMRERIFVNLSEAFLCADCEAVGNSANRCSRCQSSALIAITRVLPRHRDSIRLIYEPLDEVLKAA